MKTYIICGSRYGATKKCGEYIAKKTGGICTSDVDWQDASCIILGSNVYAGMLHKEIKAFIKSHLEELLTKKVILFVSGMDQNAIEKVVKENIPLRLQEHLHRIIFVNGILDFSKMNVIERKIIRMIYKKAHNVDIIHKGECIDKLDYQALDELCLDIKC